MRIFCAFASLLSLAECIIIRSGGSADELATAAIQDSRLTPRGPQFPTAAGGPLSYGTFTDGPNGLSGVILSTGKVEDAPVGYQCPRESVRESVFAERRVPNQCVPSTAFGPVYNRGCGDQSQFQMDIEFPEGISELRLTLIFATGEGFVGSGLTAPFCADSKQVT